MSGDDENGSTSKVDPAELETRLVLEDEVLESADADAALAEARQGDATVLADGDDRTELVTGISESETSDSSSSTPLPGTRVLDPNEARADGASAASSAAETRVLDVPEDKTSPPPVGSEAAREPVAPPAASSADLRPGTVLFGEYEIVNVLGVGGMGEVFRARHRRLDEFRAIKVMHADLSNKKGAAEFFYREAKALLAVRHPAVVHCHDLLSDDSGRVYLVMEMIEGIPLSEKMNQGPLSADDVAILGARVSHGLSAAHRKGVIHRDVSPDNIVLPRGRVQEAKLIDFGIAKILEEGEGTIIDGFKGKLSYASPEQLGFFGGKIDGRSDFYSLGLVLVAAALGRPMSMGTTVMEAVDARRGFDVLPDEIPIGLRSAISPLLALDPKDRPKYVDRLFVVPGSVEGTEPGSYERARPSETKTPGEADSTRRGILMAAAAAGLLVLASAGYWWTASGDRAPATRIEEPKPVLEGAAPASASVMVPATEAKRAPTTESASEPMAAKTPAPPARKRLRASDRIKIIGLLSNAKLALSENRLMSPAGDNAYDRYRRVLDLDPANAKAKRGLRTVAARYLSLAESSASSGKKAQAREFLVKARKADPTNPDLAKMEARLVE